MPSEDASNSVQPESSETPWATPFFRSSYMTAVQAPSFGGLMGYSRPDESSSDFPRARASWEMGASGSTR